MLLRSIIGRMRSSSSEIEKHDSGRGKGGRGGRRDVETGGFVPGITFLFLEFSICFLPSFLRHFAHKVCPGSGRMRDGREEGAESKERKGRKEDES